MSDDNWGEPVSINHDFSIEEILDMPTEGEIQNELTLTNTVCKVQMNLTNIDCVGHDDLCKVAVTNNLDIVDNESHGNNDRGIFCVIENDSDYIDIEDLY